MDTFPIHHEALILEKLTNIECHLGSEATGAGYQFDIEARKSNADNVGVTASSNEIIQSAIELGKRANCLFNSAPKPLQLGSTKITIAYCLAYFHELISDSFQEELHIVTLNSLKEVIHNHKICTGLVDQCLVHPREIFRKAIMDAASFVVLAHNHPAGSPIPSSEDIISTRRLVVSGIVLGIPVLDHIIMGRRGLISMQDQQPLLFQPAEVQVGSAPLIDES